jgi:hypothetical protein
VGTLPLIGDLRDLAFDVSSDAALTGTTFNPQGLVLATKSGSIDMHGFFCGGTETDLTKWDDLGARCSKAAVDCSA